MKLNEITKSALLNEIAIQDVQQIMSRLEGNPRWAISKDSRIDVFGSVKFPKNFLVGGKLPFPLGKIEGDFEIMDYGSPGAYVTSTVCFPTHVTGNFKVNNSSISSMKGMPLYVDGDFIFKLSRIETLDYLPRVGGSIMLDGCNIKSLKGLPSLVKGDLGISSPKLMSISGIADIVKEITGYIYLYTWNLLSTPLLGLVQIEHLAGIVDSQTGEIINTTSDSYRTKMSGLEIVAKYIEAGDNDVFGCQTELIDTGYEENAQL